ncbi:MAG: hypothetical protein ACK5DG_03760 [Chitinophagaceae bacterium]|jgi:hypothetical protein
MKKLLFALLLSLSVSAAVAQEEISFTSGRDKHDGKPQFFANLSQKFALKTGFIENMFSFKKDETVIVTVSEGFVFNGKVISKTVESNGLEVITLESNQRKGLVLSVSKYTRPDGTVDYMGVITSREFSDMIMLEKDIITGNYQWTRKNLSQMIAD